MAEFDWQHAGACKGVDTIVFFPSREEESDLSVTICKRCIVKTECLDYAYSHKEKEGTWGGQTEWQRRRQVRKEARIRSANKPIEKIA